MGFYFQITAAKFLWVINLTFNLFTFQGKLEVSTQMFLDIMKIIHNRKIILLYFRYTF